MSRSPHRRHSASTAVAALLALAALTWSAGTATPALAVAAAPSDDLPDLADVKALIYSGAHDQAVARLEALSREVQHAEVYNLLGYSLRQLGRYDEAGRAYREALHFDGSYRPALQYQGELFLATGDIDGARRNLAYLRIVCGPAGCAEQDRLTEALTRAGHPPEANGPQSRRP